MTNKVSRIIYAALIAAALAVVIGGKFPSVGKHFLKKEAVPQGDLSRLSGLDRFSQPVKVVTPTPTAPLENAAVVTMGDSFFNSSLESDLFANEVARKGGMAVHNVALRKDFEPCSYPLAYLASIGYRGDRRRILVLETVERNTFERTIRYCAAARTSAAPTDTLANRVLDNGDVEYFFKNNLVVHPLLKWLKNARFRWFGKVDQAIGAYSENPSMLFFHSDLDFAAIKKDDAVVDAAADQVAWLAALLRERYNMELLYVVMPDKYSLYRRYVRDATPYDLFVPRLVDRLHRRGVHALDMYSAYLNRETPGHPFFFAGDTHYTAAGKAVLVDECLREIAAINGERSR
ncbi:alginate O-acetyltransferase AlgX-related protein [Geomonas sp.]|uniref:alginate O-acetyltransferase AlgX-related protein n=1 Tax=Geomonas sp. TaxID=2651584 RepID=UPI002B460A17|nr:hypothetical protein [Geomonas sp.]HJV36718.1 hypothetical protein [Geomonas sp.]